MNFDTFKQFEPLYIIGHKNPDVDSIIATILLAKIFNSKGIKCHSCILKDGYELDEYNRKILDDCGELELMTISLDEQYNYVLVDHNDPTQSVGFGKKIIWGIDHHTNSHILSNILISDYCSCSLFIYAYFKNDYEFTNEEKFMIYMASLTDSLFFKGSRFSEKDKNLIAELGFDLDANELFKKYFIPTDLSLGLDNVFDFNEKQNNSVKSHTYKGVKFDSLVIKTHNEYDYLKQEFIKKIEERPNFLGIWIDFDKEISYAYFNYNGKVKEFIYDF